MQDFLLFSISVLYSPSMSIWPSGAEYSLYLRIKVLIRHVFQQWKCLIGEGWQSDEALRCAGEESLRWLSRVVRKQEADPRKPREPSSRALLICHRVSLLLLAREGRGPNVPAWSIDAAIPLGWGWKYLPCILTKEKNILKTSLCKITIKADD